VFSLGSQVCHLGRAFPMIAPCVLILNLPRRRKCRTGHTFGLTESSVAPKIRIARYKTLTRIAPGECRWLLVATGDVVSLILRHTASNRNPQTSDDHAGRPGLKAAPFSSGNTTCREHSTGFQVRALLESNPRPR
jgi:hypothetical protein